jgi:hypothetical protein
MKPLRKRSGLEADVLDPASLVANEPGDCRGVAVHLSFLDDDPALIDDADARAVRETSIPTKNCMTTHS